MLEFLSPAVFAAVVRVSSSPVFSSLLATASQLAWRVAADETLKESALAAISHLNSVHEGSPHV